MYYVHPKIQSFHNSKTYNIAVFLVLFVKIILFTVFACKIFVVTTGVYIVSGL